VGQEKKMPHVMSAERIGREEGMEKGMLFEAEGDGFRIP